MGGLREWGNQAAGRPNEGYEPAVYFPWAAIISNISPGHIVTSADEVGSTGKDADGIAIGAYKPATFSNYANFFGKNADGKFNMAVELYNLRTENGGNPYVGISAYDPDDDIRRVRDAITKLSREVDRRRGERDITEAVKIAKTNANELLDDDTIDEMIEAERARQHTDYLTSKSNLLRDLWIGGGLMVSNTIGDLAMLEDSFNRNIAAIAAKARLAREDQRANFAMHLVDVHIARSNEGVSMQQVYLSAALDALKSNATVKQDQLDKDIEYAQAYKFWNVGLLQLALNANSAIYGAQMQTRGQTKSERLTAAITSSASAGIQAGMATGSPAAGVAFAGLNFLSQTLFN